MCLISGGNFRAAHPLPPIWLPQWIKKHILFHHSRVSIYSRYLMLHNTMQCISNEPKFNLFRLIQSNCHVWCSIHRIRFLRVNTFMSKNWWTKNEPELRWSWGWDFFQRRWIQFQQQSPSMTWRPSGLTNGSVLSSPRRQSAWRPVNLQKMHKIDWKMHWNWNSPIGRISLIEARYCCSWIDVLEELLITWKIWQ